MTTTSVNSTVVSTLLAAADGTRTTLIITNRDSADLYLKFGGGPASTAVGGWSLVRGLNAGAILSAPDSFQSVYGIWTSANGGYAEVDATNTPVSDGNSAISTYGELKTAIGNWLRPGSTPSADMTARIPQYIGLAEVQIRRELHLRSLDQVEASLTITDGEASIPTGFQGVISLVSGEEPYNQITALPIDQVRTLAAQPGRTKPAHYAISGGLIYFDFAGDGVAELGYRRGVTPLSADADTNWILAGHPDVYMFGALVQAAIRLVDPRLSEFRSMFLEAIDSIQRLERNVNLDVIRPMPNGYAP